MALWIFNLRRLQNLKERRLPSRRMLSAVWKPPLLVNRLFYWRRFNALLAPDWLIRLSDDRNDFVLGIQ